MSRHSLNPGTHKCTMERAVRRLRQEKIFFEELTAYHIKVGDLNFYPGRGTIYRDGDYKAFAKTGLDAFVNCARPRKRTEKNLNGIVIPFEDDESGLS